MKTVYSLELESGVILVLEDKGLIIVGMKELYEENSQVVNA